MNHLNLSYIIENVTDDQAFIEEILIIFLEGLDDDYPVLLEQIEQDNYEGIEQAAHKLKSSFRSLGMMEGWSLLEAIEDIGHSKGSISEIEAKMNAFVRMMPEVKKEVKTYIDTHKG